MFQNPLTAVNHLKPFSPSRIDPIAEHGTQFSPSAGGRSPKPSEACHEFREVCSCCSLESEKLEGLSLWGEGGTLAKSFAASL